eukprot:UN33982
MLFNDNSEHNLYDNHEFDHVNANDQNKEEYQNESGFHLTAAHLKQHDGHAKELDEEKLDEPPNDVIIDNNSPEQEDQAQPQQYENQANNQTAQNCDVNSNNIPPPSPVHLLPMNNHDVSGIPTDVHDPNNNNQSQNLAHDHINNQNQFHNVNINQNLNNFQTQNQNISVPQSSNSNNQLNNTQSYQQHQLQPQ